MKLTKNFSKSEFDSKDGSPMPLEVLQNIQELANNLQVIRDYINRPIKINSGYRSPSHNKAVGGVKNSQHVIGMAGDLVVSNMSTVNLAITIEYLIKEGKISEGGIGIYNTFVHYDIRGTRARWDNKT